MTDRPGGRPSTSAAVLAAIAGGGVLGALARYGVGELWPHRPNGFPWATVGVNVSGSLAIGVLMACVAAFRVPGLLRPFAGIGVLGGFTTFSTAMVDARGLIAAGHPVIALLSVLVTWSGALGAVFVGWRATLAAVDRGRA